MALRPCSGVLLEGALTSGMCGGGGGQAAPAGLVCALGAGRDSGPQEHGLGTRSPAPPPDPRFLGFRSPVLGCGDTCRGVSPLQGWIQLERK